MKGCRFREPRWSTCLASGLFVALFSAAVVDSAWGQPRSTPPGGPPKRFSGYGGLPGSVKKPCKHLPRVAKVDDARTSECHEVAAKIDRLVEANLARHGLEPNSPADDHTFVRRVFLDVTGSIPTLVETNAYATSKQARKPEELIDALLESYGYVSHLYNYWASILRILDQPSQHVLAYSYRSWVKEQLRINRPYDQWVYEMLTAEGKPWENPAVGYRLRDEGMPMVHVDNTIRIFLGTRIGCAQCHDHPSDSWTQQDFYQLAAFTHGTHTRDASDSAAFLNGDPIQRVREQMKESDPSQRLQGSMDLLLHANLHRVSYQPKRQLKFPVPAGDASDVASEVVEPQVLWGEVPEASRDLPLPAQYAAWLTSPDNQRFATTIANRLWKKVMGVGLIEPVDDLRDDSACENRELLDLLRDEMIRLRFNQKEFLRTLLYTKTYQRESSNFDPSQQAFYHFPGPRLRRMTAEQIWDSILTIAIVNPFSVEPPSNDQFAEVVDMDLASVSLEKTLKQSSKYDELFGPEGQTKLMQGSTYRQQLLARASELPSPLPPDHFLCQFGQCDRQTIEGDSCDPNVPQLLTMFNGPFTHMMLEEGSVIHQNLVRSTSARDAMQVMFLSILNRPPSPQDREIAMREISRGDPGMGFGNLVWALINTREFLFVP